MSAFQLSMLYSLGLAIVGYLLISLLGSFNLPPSVLFAAGLFIGGFIITIVFNASNTSDANATSTTAPSETTAKVRNESKSEKSNANNNDNGPTKTIYVGNLPYRANEAIIKELFEKFGYVNSVRLLKDRQTGKRRGFGFVEMGEAAAATAIAALNESEFQQRTLKVREAKDRPEREDGDEDDF